MVFSSPVFLFLFLPACLLAALVAAGVDRAVRRRHVVQNLVLLAFSLGFYLYGSGRHLLIMLASIAVSWLCGLALAHLPLRRVTLALAVAGQLAVLGWFKYANFAVAQIDVARDHLGLPAMEWTEVLLPIGISFFVFQAISYCIDVYRGECAPRRSPLDVALYIALFPQLIAGPIVRYREVAAQIDARTAPLDDVARGAVRFTYGLCKKVIVADAVGEIADAAFGLPAAEMTGAVAWLGAFAYTFQIYFDFSAYSDMAIGLGRIFGFTFPENFRRPFAAPSITDFWRRWHITLSSWFRDYVYLPLGGNRAGRLRTAVNLWAVFLLSGLWHGASWTFVIWGAWHGALLTLERVLGLRADPRGLVAAGRRALTFLLVVVGFTIFRSADVDQALLFYRNMLAPTDWTVPLELTPHLSHRNLVLFVVAGLSVALPGGFVAGRFLEDGRGRVATAARVTVMTAGALVAAAVLASNQFSPFIYFRF